METQIITETNFFTFLTLMKNALADILATSTNLVCVRTAHFEFILSQIHNNTGRCTTQCQLEMFTL